MIEKLTVNDARNEIALIKKYKGDEGQAHGLEDSLRDWFIECCAIGMYDQMELIIVAQIVLSSNEIEFTRYTE